MPNCTGGRSLKTSTVKPIYFTRRQAALMLSCSDQTISKMHKEGRLPFYYLGRHAVRIRLEDLEAMLISDSSTSRSAL
jgi:excisionase family DNA binding protein